MEEIPFNNCNLRVDDPSMTVHTLDDNQISYPSCSFKKKMPTISSRLPNSILKSNWPNSFYIWRVMDQWSYVCFFCTLKLWDVIYLALKWAHRLPTHFKKTDKSIHKSLTKHNCKKQRNWLYTALPCLPNSVRSAYIIFCLQCPFCTKYTSYSTDKVNSLF